MIKYKRNPITYIIAAHYNHVLSQLPGKSMFGVFDASTFLIKKGAYYCNDNLNFASS
jgi:hypothetical protein